MSADTALAAPRRHHSIDRGSSIGLLLVALPVFLLAWLIVFPIFSAVVGTIFVRGPDGATEFSLASYRFFFTDGYSVDNLWLTLWTTAVCGILLLAIGLPIALYLRFSQGRLAAYVQGLAIFPMFVPSIILAYALIRTIGPNGTVDLLLNSVGLPKLRTPYLTPWGPVIGLVWDNLPLTVLMLTAGLSSVSNSAIEAARDVGARPLRVFISIILPRMGNSLLVTASFAVLGIFSAFTLPYVLGPASPEMMGPFMQRTFADMNDPLDAMTQAVITFGFCLVFGIFYIRSIARNREARP
ncbi:ABC-type spermidine/putrescine transport system, permease component I [Rhizobium leguminosarum bv. trifolii WSM2297]|uniref:ABC-type spermidine/putrescine transport system, permease component I n=1 Tax=Rhizobium leguminosarum bv. trifolii WSM2297 TaxID=754762 RepID=J0L139_RHILT|nr:ABC transporter permease subunit [Rhizobium leguminosarum]EJC83884.1 ABC-type spermidine/putrescine transport system, permease component I [Rhizobium leguminosarum bv. trifolii WSM2297]EJC84525.1 ABC-type spermidine/putrescine transport system, permease component I [Rhizobium leguminosarum bv. trifolii WSM2297]